MILKGDCIEVMKAIKSNSVDAIVCDPPYNLHFMGKDWDKDLLHEKWLTEAYRVLKPGGSMLVMGGTRTFHRLACAIEDSGFIIKDTLMWLYGSGFPKAQDLGKMIDKRMGKERTVDLIPTKKGNLPEMAGEIALGATGFTDISKPQSSLAKHWDGFKVGGIKPAYEPIVWAVKPPEGSYVDNVLKHRVGAVNVDECRIKVESDDDNKRRSTGKMGGSDSCFGVGNKYRPETLSKGRFPANIILDEEAGRLLDEQSGELKSGEWKGQLRPRSSNIDYGASGSPIYWKANSGGASRFFYTAKASRGDRNIGLGDLMIDGKRQEGKKEKFSATMGDGIGKREHNPDEDRAWVKNNHPTVKPIKLFEWLIRLVTREGQIILDPFLGSGTTAIAAHNAGRKCVGIEKEDEYLEIAKKRIEYWKKQPIQMELI